MDQETGRQSQIAAHVAANLASILARPTTDVERQASERQYEVAEKRRQAAAGPDLSMRLGSASLHSAGLQNNEEIT